MQFADLCHLAGLPEAHGDVFIKTIVHDSRQVTPGCLFVAIKGLRHDGHNDIAQAVRNGAVAVVVEDSSALVGIDCPACVVTSSAQALGVLWAAWLDWPSRHLRIVGVTGTDGKTTTAHVIHHLLTSAGIKAGLVSTVSAVIGDQHMDTGFHVTSPDAPQLQQLLASMVTSGLTHVVLEVTSHGIAQQRIAGVDFDLAVLTNLTSDHLDYHGTVELYKATKAKLFMMATHSVLNKDDAEFSYFASAAKGSVYDYSLTGPAFSQAADIVPFGAGSRFRLKMGDDWADTHLLLPGRYNISNALAAAAVAYLWGVGVGNIAQSLATFTGVPGRFETYQTRSGVTIVVDFAHTAQSLRHILAVALTLKSPGGRLWHVFGCAGERDASKRPVMGRISADYADEIILTTEDPRHEVVATINAEIIEGIKQSSNQPVYTEITDRGQAIATAVDRAQVGDVVLITGKGHEQSLAIGDQEILWSDSQAVQSLIR